jgi:DNA (cytosine-5)-methyltransferase 1
MPIAVIDLFAGPGGLGEGFSALRRDGQPVFKIKLSIEKDPFAHQTLRLRAFFRQFPDGKAPEEYYDHLAGKLTQDELFEKFPKEKERAADEAWHAELGHKDFPYDIVGDRIADALGNRVNWVLIGGPPCQAYSLVGRSRRKNDPTFRTDEKHFLYKEYLRIIADHQPPVFVMENVKGLLSAKVEEEGILEKILNDLENPLDAIYGRHVRRHNLTYRLFSLVVRDGDLFGRCPSKDFVVRAEDYGIPQARHRVVVLGVDSEIDLEPGVLTKQQETVSIEDVISDLPHLRSGLSKEPDSADAWREALIRAATSDWFRSPKVNAELRAEIQTVISAVNGTLDRGSMFEPATRRIIRCHRQWFEDPRIGGVCNHATRSHIKEDLHRYLFAAAFARVHGRSPLLNDMPQELLPKHKNVDDALKDTKFNDRFRVQVKGQPSTTVTSHISKDGHYFIHYDPTQCRSLTVREAARLQTFPDNYFFEGPRTQQYHQVGNAVPPLLARQIAEIVADLFR